MSDRISPSEQYRRNKLKQGRSPDAQRDRYLAAGRALDEKAKQAIREQLALQRRQGQNVKVRINKATYNKARR